MKRTNSLKQLKQKREQVLAIAAKHGAYDVRVFGSVARGEDTPKSDIDFLVKPRPKTTPWFPAPLIRDLEDLLGRRVEGVTERGLNPALRKQVFNEAIAL